MSFTAWFRHETLTIQRSTRTHLPDRLSRRLKEPSPYVIPYVIAIEGNTLKRVLLLYVSSIAHTHSLNWTAPISHATVNEYSLEM